MGVYGQCNIPAALSPGNRPSTHVTWDEYLSRYGDCKMGTGSFPGVKCGWGVLLTTHPLLVLRSQKSRAIRLPTLWACNGITLPSPFYPRYRRLGKSQVRSGRVRKISPPTKIQSPDHPAHSEFPDQLRYPCYLVHSAHYQALHSAPFTSTLLFLHF